MYVCDVVQGTNRCMFLLTDREGYGRIAEGDRKQKTRVCSAGGGGEQSDPTDV